MPNTMEFDLVIFNGYIVTGSDITPPSAYIGIKDGIIQTITTIPLKGKKIIDAQGGFITPGGIDSHVHIDQGNAPTGDTFESGSRAAIAGGTTTMIPFAVQPKTEDNLIKVVKDYHATANKNGPIYCDYAFHLIISEPSEDILQNQLPKIVETEGITSVKLYTTYPYYKLTDLQLLDILLVTRKLNVTTMVHAENADLIDFIGAKLQEKKLMEPHYHALSRPLEAEDEASYRVISLANFIDVPILLVHMSSTSALEHVRKAQTNMAPIFAETCPQYLFLTSECLKSHSEDQFEGAKFICSPPLRREQKELDGVWKAIMNGTVTVFSSDHAPSKYDHPEGKKRGLVNGLPHFKLVPNGLPGIETRMPLLFCYGVETGRITPQRFVELTSTNPAKLYGLTNKGSVSIGMDADITIWYPKEKMGAFKLTNAMMHHDIDYVPYEGMEFTNWPRYTIIRGTVVFDRDNGGLTGERIGQYIRRGRSALAGPRGTLNEILE